MLDFRIETFLCVCKYMNYTKAAAELNITQPGVSQHIKYLENYYGDKLFCYSNKSLELTQAGVQLRDSMISIKRDNILLRRMIGEGAEAMRSIRFGATLTIGEFMLPENLSRFIRENKDVYVDFKIADTRELLDLLDDGSIDFAVIEGYFQKSQYDFMTVSREPYILVCGKDYPLGDRIRLEELFNHKLIVREDGSGTKEILERYLPDKGYSIDDFKSSLTVSSIHVIKNLLLNNCGVSFMYEIGARKELRDGTLRKIEIPDFPLYHEFNYIWRRNSVFKEYYQSLFPLIISPR